ncbi:MAG: hypothetical protein GDA39_10520 [Hyphomonadaceae bacterium]|nr:hypothetical protein [Hyphomonadaceae bacterium]MBC6413257.1 hypothetical protein [Hyphomonadaceae bacterium]
MGRARYITREKVKAEQTLKAAAMNLLKAAGCINPVSARGGVCPKRRKAAGVKSESALTGPGNPGPVTVKTQNPGESG